MYCYTFKFFLIVMYLENFLLSFSKLSRVSLLALFKSMAIFKIRNQTVP